MKRNILLLCLSCVLLISCGTNNSKMEQTHFPFKESKNDKWGLVDANGKILIEDEFKEKPSPAINGIFFVEEDKGYEMYSVKDPLKPIGDIYKNIAPFSDEITPSVKEDKGIKIIDKKGNVKYELPLTYTSASNFVNGYSLVSKKEDGKTMRTSSS